MKLALFSWIKLLFFFFIFCLLLFWGTKGIVYSDEGYILHSAQRIIEGQVPYKDFHFVYTPISIYVTAFSFLLFGKSVLVARLLMVVINFGTAYLLFYLLQIISKQKVLPFLGVLLYISWGASHIPFPWPVMFAISFSILSLYLQLLGIKKKNTTLVVFSGVCAGFVFLSKQNFGIAIIVSYLVSLGFEPYLQNKKSVLTYFLGIIGLGIVYLGYLLISSSLARFISDFSVYTLKRIVVEQTLSTAFFYGTSSYDLIKTVWYLFPLIVTVISGYVVFLKRRKFLFLVVFVGVFYLLGIRPTTDYIHLSPLISLLGIPFTLLYENLDKMWQKTGLVLIMSILVISGFYTAYFSGFYKWEPALVHDTYFLSLARGQIFIDDYHKAEFERLTSIITQKTSKTDPIYVYAYSPMIYFMTDRNNPTSYDLIEPTDFYSNTEKDIASTLQKKKVNLIVTSGPFGKTTLWGFIKKEYNKTDHVNGFSVWVRKTL